MRLIITVEDDKPSTAASLTSVADAVAENAGMSAQQSAVGGLNQHDGTNSFESALADGATSAGAAPDAPAASETMFLGESPSLAEQSHDNADTSAGPGTFID